MASDSTGFVTFTYDDIGHVREVICAWGGSCSGYCSGTSRKITGTVIKAVTVPASSSTDSASTGYPLDNYDVTITDEYGVDITGNCILGLGNRDTTATEEVYLQLKAAGSSSTGGIALHPAVNSALTFTVDNSGISNAGTIRLYYKMA